MMSEDSVIKLRSGAQMPMLGLGTWQLTKDAAGTIAYALKLDYRMIDTACDYGSQLGIGEAIRRGIVDRKSIYLVIKVEESDQAHAATRKYLREIGVDYADLVLIHRPPEQDVGSPEITEFHCPPPDFRLLEHFIAHPERAIPRAELVENVWGGQEHASSRAVDVQITRLRQLLEPFDLNYLITGVGYRYSSYAQQVGNGFAGRKRRQSLRLARRLPQGCALGTSWWLTANYRINSQWIRRANQDHIFKLPGRETVCGANK